MKSLKTLGIPMILCGFGAILFFAPSSRAQECSPEIFDTYGAAPAPVKAKSQPTASSHPVRQATAQSSKTSGNATLQPAAARQPQSGQNRGAVAVPAKGSVRKREPDKQ